MFTQSLGFSGGDSVGVLPAQVDCEPLRRHNSAEICLSALPLSPNEFQVQATIHSACKSLTQFEAHSKLGLGAIAVFCEMSLRSFAQRMSAKNCPE